MQINVYIRKSIEHVSVYIILVCLGLPTPEVDNERKIDITLKNADGVDWQGL